VTYPPDVTTDSGVVSAEPTARATRTAGTLLIAGGLLSIVLWLVFTSIHGPTSFNEEGRLLGQGIESWGMLLGVVPNVLIAAGLWSIRARLLGGRGRVPRIGFALLLGGLLGSAALDLALGGLSAPLLLPFVAAGLIFLGLPLAGHEERTIGRILLGIGILIAIAFAWALVPRDVSDPIGGYRIYGFMAHLLTGLGWALLGVVVASRTTDGATAA
jgi:hypothetical protein